MYKYFVMVIYMLACFTSIQVVANWRRTRSADDGFMFPGQESTITPMESTTSELESRHITGASSNCGMGEVSVDGLCRKRFTANRGSTTVTRKPKRVTTSSSNINVTKKH
ncbi:hypothetical protein PPYR_06723 [Photinus pyralis]|uniref:Uncharacterized protein n=1 Tax=Photinus pyralis TaxID=7054 RepID=A0A5N4ANI2_PHOPY|nr:hypothetical protein PPYR_06723 [Photinus pyralis]